MHVNGNPALIWIRHGLILLAALFTSLLLVIAGLVVFLDDSDYRDILEWTADTFLDASLEINGPFTLTVGRELSLAAGDVRLQHSGDEFTLHMTTFAVQLQLPPLLQGNWWISNLQTSGVHLRINESESADDENFALKDLTIPRVVLERVHLADIRVSYQPRNTTEVLEYALDELALDEFRQDGPLRIRAAGEFEARPFAITGELGSHRQLVDPATAYPIRLALESQGLFAAATGSIDDPLVGRGVDLQVSVIDSDVSNTLAPFIPELPPGRGQFGFESRLHGDYDALGLDGIVLGLSDGERKEVLISGEVQDLRTGAGTNLDLSMHLNDAPFWQWLSKGNMPTTDAATLTGHLREQDGLFYLEQLISDLATRNGIKVHAAGAMVLNAPDYKDAAQIPALEISFASPTTTALAGPGVAGMPELGPVTLQTRLRYFADGIAVDAFDTALGKAGTLRLTARGAVKFAPLTPGVYPEGLDVTLAIRAADTTQLGALLGQDIPALGPMVASVRASGELPVLKLADLDLSLGRAGSLRATLTGKAMQLDVEPPFRRNRGQFRFQGETPDVATLKRLLDVELPALGALRTSAQLTVNGLNTAVRDFTLTAGPKSAPVHQIAGSLDYAADKGLNADFEVDASTDALLSLVAPGTPKNFGRIAGHIRLAEAQGKWRLKDVALSARDTTLFKYELSGRIADLASYTGTDLHTRWRVDSPADLTMALGLPPVSLPAAQGEARLSGNSARLEYAGQTSVGKTRFDAVLHGSVKGKRPAFTGRVTSVDLDLADLGLVPVEPPPQTDRPKDKQKDTPPAAYLFSREPLSLQGLRAVDVDIALNIDRIHGANLDIQQLKGNIKLNDGLLQVRDAVMTYESGAVSTDFSLDARTTPEITLKARVDDLVFGSMVAQVRKGVPMRGYADLALNIRGRGQSLHDLAGSLSGSFDLVLENAYLPTYLLDFLSFDLLGWTLDTATFRDRQERVDCVLLDFTLVDGVAESRSLVAEGPNLAVEGRATIDLGAETIDMVLLPKKKKNTWSSVTPVKLTGKLNDPSVTAIPAKAAATSIGTLVAVPYVVVSMRILESVLGLIKDGDKYGDGCTALLGRTVKDGKGIAKQQ
jgi:hypothetical protein